MKFCFPNFIFRCFGTFYVYGPYKEASHYTFKVPNLSIVWCRSSDYVLIIITRYLPSYPFAGCRWLFCWITGIFHCSTERFTVERSCSKGGSDSVIVSLQRGNANQLPIFERASCRNITVMLGTELIFNGCVSYRIWKWLKSGESDWTEMQFGLVVVENKVANTLKYLQNISQETLKCRAEDYAKSNFKEH